MMKTIPALIAIATLLISESAVAAKLKLPQGMGGVPDIGAIPCSVFSEMLVVGPLGTRHSLLTWANGYWYAQTGKATDELLAIAEAGGDSWDFERLTDHLVAYCAANPEAVTRDAVTSLGAELIAD
jgi:hypothetical protein